MRYDKSELYKLECRVQTYIEKVMGIAVYGGVQIHRDEKARNVYYIGMRLLDVYIDSPKHTIEILNKGLGVNGFELQILETYRYYYICKVKREDLCRLDTLFKMMGFDAYGHNIQYRKKED